MARRVRDYAAEYARRKALHPEDITAARGHGSREKESAERMLRSFINRNNVRVDDNGRILRRGYEGGKKPSLRGVVTRDNATSIKDYLREARAASKEYEKGNPERGRALWRQRDPSMPEWMFWYHGAFG